MSWQIYISDKKALFDNRTEHHTNNEHFAVVRLQGFIQEDFNFIFFEIQMQTQSFNVSYQQSHFGVLHCSKYKYYMKDVANTKAQMLHMQVYPTSSEHPWNQQINVRSVASNQERPI